MRTGADTLKRVTLELGGKSPNIVFADADSTRRDRGQRQRHLLEPGRDLLGGHARVRRAAALRRRGERVRGPRSAIVVGDGSDEATRWAARVEGAAGARRAVHRDRVKARRRSPKQGARPTDAAPRERLLRPADDVRRRRQRRDDRARGDLRPGDVGDPVHVGRGGGRDRPTTTSTAWPPPCGPATSRRRMHTAKALRAGIVWINDSQPAPTETPWGGYKQSGIGRELGARRGRLPRDQAHLREPGRRSPGRDQRARPRGASRPPAMMPNVAMTITLMEARRLKLCGDPAQERRAPDESGVADRGDGGDRVRGILVWDVDQTERRRRRGGEREAEHQVGERDHEHLVGGDRDRAADQPSRSRRRGSWCAFPSRTGRGSRRVRPNSTADANAMNAKAAVLADAPSSLRRYSPDQVSIDPSTRNADSTTSAGTPGASACGTAPRSRTSVSADALDVPFPRQRADDDQTDGDREGDARVREPDPVVDVGRPRARRLRTPR